MNIENEKFQIVAQDNRICQIAYAKNASHELNICQKRLILLMISRINKNDKDFKIESISFKQFLQIMKIPNGGNTEKKIKESVHDLINKNFLLDTLDEKNSSVYSWVDPINTCVDWENKMIYFQLSSSLKKFYLNLHARFTCFQLGFTTEFKHKYTHRIYEYLHSYLSQEKIIVKREDAFRIFCNNNYYKVADLDRYALKKAIEEINEFSDITVNYYRRKNGREVTHYFFMVKRKSTDEINDIRDTWSQQKSVYDTLKDEFSKFESLCSTDAENQTEENTYESEIL